MVWEFVFFSWNNWFILDLTLIAKSLHEINSFVNAVAWVQAWPKFHQLFVILYDLLSPVLWVQFLGVFFFSISTYGFTACALCAIWRKMSEEWRSWSEMWDHNTYTISIHKKCTITNRDEVTQAVLSGVIFSFCL